MERPGRGLVRAGVVVTALSLLLPPLSIVPVVIGIVLLVRRRVGAGILILVLGGFVLPIAGALLYSALLLKPYRVPSEAMSPGLKLEERFVSLKLDKTPEVGDIVVFRPPAGSQSASEQCGAPPEPRRMCARPTADRAPDIEFVKRVVARGGDRIAMRAGRIIRNGRPEPRRPLGECPEGQGGCDYPEEITVPAGHYYMLGDNRGASDDSRFWGPVPADAITGRYWFTYRGG